MEGSTPQRGGGVKRENNKGNKREREKKNEEKRGSHLASISVKTIKVR